MAHGFLNGSRYDEETLSLATLIDRSVTEIKIPEGVKVLGTSAFAYASKLKKITFPESLQSLGSSALTSCSQLEKVVFPIGCTRLSSNALQSCGCKRIVLGDVTQIGTYVFANTKNCTVFDFSRNTTVPKLDNVNSFNGINAAAMILVPSSLYREWIEATNWSQYESYIVPVKSLPDTDKVQPTQSKFNIYINAEQLKYIADATGIGIGEIVLQSDENVPFVRFYGDDSSKEAYATAVNLSSTISGKYLSFAYRVSDANIEDHAFFDIFANTSGTSFTGKSDVLRLNIDKDGKWHVVVIDLEEALYAAWTNSAVKPNSDGSYTIQRLRIDFFNVPTSTTSYIDVAYVGMCDNIDKARAADPDWEGYTMIPGRLGENDDSVSYIENVDENGMKYYTVTSTTTSRGERGYVFHDNPYNYIANTSRYIGILYRNAPGGYAQIYCGSIADSGWVVSIKGDYETGEDWKFMILAIDNELYKDSVCHYLRFDYFNELAANTQYSIDIASVKFFASEMEAKSYYGGIIAKYGLTTVAHEEV